jgi:hypothetical protein
MENVEDLSSSIVIQKQVKINQLTIYISKVTYFKNILSDKFFQRFEPIRMDS